MPDMFFNEAGDIERSPSGDIALTQTIWRDDVQQAYIRVMTDQGDYLLYPELGATLSSLYGLPNSPETAQTGCDLIEASLRRESRFTGRPFRVNAVPTGPQTIRFDVFVTSGTRDEIRLSVEQNLGVS